MAVIPALEVRVNGSVEAVVATESAGTVHVEVQLLGGDGHVLPPFGSQWNQDDPEWAKLNSGARMMIHGLSFARQEVYTWARLQLREGDVVEVKIVKADSQAVPRPKVTKVKREP